MDLPPPLIDHQLAGILDASLLGFLLAAGYDCYRAFRASSGLRSPAAIFCVDFLFWVAATVFSLWRFFAYRWGEIVMPTYISLAVGAAAYFILFSRFLLPLWSGIFATLFGALRRLAALTGLAKRTASRPLAVACRGTGVVFNKAGSRARLFLSRIFSFRPRS